ncbi:hypothetical protein ACFE04_017018 [Oxalis oulophora]
MDVTKSTSDHHIIIPTTTTTPSTLLTLVQQIVNNNTFDGCLLFKKDCIDLIRKLSLLSHLLEEITDYFNNNQSQPLDHHQHYTMVTWFSHLNLALLHANNLLSIATSFTSSSNDGDAKKIAFQFQCVTWKLEKALANIPYECFEISEEVQEQVDLVKSQLRRATERYGSMNSKSFSRAMSLPPSKDVDSVILAAVLSKQETVSVTDDSKVPDDGRVINRLERVRSCPDASRSSNADAFTIPDDFLCPIALELMRDPVIVSTGQTYERAYMQRWIDCGNLTCPKTQQKLDHFTLTPNYVLKSLISRFCAKHNIEQPTGLTNGKLKKSDGSFRDVSNDIAAIEAVVRKLASQSVEERRAAVSEIRSLSKRSTDNRILIAEAGAIPTLVNLMTTDDVETQENAVTSVLNLSIYENNKGLIMLAGAIPSIVQVLRSGSMEARENAAATLFSLSLGDENKIIIGGSGAIPALVDLLRNGTTRGKKDAATALFNLCIYQGNKGRAIRSGIIPALLKMLTDSRNCMIDEALTIMSVLASNNEAKAAIVKANNLPVLLDLLRAGLPRNKENAASILLSLCKRDSENLSCINGLGAVIPLTELARNGTERAKRKASSLLEHLRRLQEHECA